MKNENLPEHKIPIILIVDDIPANLKLLGDILKSEGYKIRPVPNGEMALQVAEKEKPGLILLDIMMPGIDGYEVCRRLKENPALKDIPVIFISALNDTDDIVKALAMGGVDYISKPFQSEEVRARVQTHLKIYQLSKELKEINATKDKFFSIIAHDLRSPFTAFLGLTKMMVEDKKNLSPEMIDKMVGMLNKSATNLFSLLENLLEWSLMQRGATSFVPESFLLNSKVSDCIELTLDAARNKEILINTNIPDSLAVYADKRMFEAVIRNLITNALKFTPKGGTITVSAMLADTNFVEITIRDTGIGISADLIDKLFLLDAQTGRKGTEGEPSSGLGLIICKDFIEKHGGEIWIESEEGNGAAFTFSMPVI
ncbi:MAG: hybrid sensor histidine kinase/response regulator [Bacteroidetes bacterium]|nr:hybrid sensor histidine kinase/response regulator [Bacteroidota bacterium]